MQSEKAEAEEREITQRTNRKNMSEAAKVERIRDQVREHQHRQRHRCARNTEYAQMLLRVSLDSGSAETIELSGTLASRKCDRP